MKAFLASIVAVAVIAVGAAFTLKSLDMNTADTYTAKNASVRISDSDKYRASDISDTDIPMVFR